MVPKLSAEEWREVIDMLFKNWQPFPDREYCERTGIPMKDGKPMLPGPGFVHIEYQN